MPSCIIIEDQPPAQRILQKYIRDIGTLNLQGTFSDALTALEYLKHNTIDIIFLDIHLPKISGIDFLKILNPQPQVIITTAFSDYALQGYELDVVDYLLKPFSFERFAKSVAKVAGQTKKETSATQNPIHQRSGSVEKPLFVKTGKEYQKIEIDTIQLIKSNGDYTHLFTTNGKHVASHSLKYWIEKLDSDLFCQIHKSYLVNVRHISKVTGNQVSIGDNLLPIGRTYREIFFSNYLERDE